MAQAGSSQQKEDSNPAITRQIAQLTKRTQVWLSMKHDRRARNSCHPGGNIELVALVNGPRDTPYASGTWAVVVSPARDHPLTAPRLRFLNKIYHPNVCPNSGVVRHARTVWLPCATLVYLVMDAMTAMLRDPSELPEDVMNLGAHKMKMTNLEAFEEVVRKNVAETATEAITKKLVLNYLMVPARSSW